MPPPPKGLAPLQTPHVAAIPAAEVFPAAGASKSLGEPLKDAACAALDEVDEVEVFVRANIIDVWGLSADERGMSVTMKLYIEGCWDSEAKALVGWQPKEKATVRTWHPRLMVEEVMRWEETEFELFNESDKTYNEKLFEKKMLCYRKLGICQIKLEGDMKAFPFDSHVIKLTFRSKEGEEKDKHCRVILTANDKFPSTATKAEKMSLRHAYEFRWNYHQEANKDAAAGSVEGNTHKTTLSSPSTRGLTSKKVGGVNQKWSGTVYLRLKGGRHLWRGADGNHANIERNKRLYFATVEMVVRRRTRFAWTMILFPTIALSVLSLLSFVFHPCMLNNRVSFSLGVLFTSVAFQLATKFGDQNSPQGLGYLLWMDHFHMFNFCIQLFVPLVQCVVYISNEKCERDDLRFIGGEPVSWSIEKDQLPDSILGGLLGLLFLAGNLYNFYEVIYNFDSIYFDDGDDPDLGRTSNKRRVSRIAMMRRSETSSFPHQLSSLERGGTPIESFARRTASKLKQMLPSPRLSHTAKTSTVAPEEGGGAKATSADS